MSIFNAKVIPPTPTQELLEAVQQLDVLERAAAWIGSDSYGTYKCALTAAREAVDAAYKRGRG